MNILFIKAFYRSPGRFNNRDFELKEALENAGHTVSAVESARPTEVFQPVIVVTAASIDPAWATDPRPIICLSSAVAAMLGLTGATLSVAPFSGIVTVEAPIDHELTEGFRLLGNYYGLAPGDEGLGTAVASLGGVNLVVLYEKGIQRHDSESETLPGRRVLFCPDGADSGGMRWTHWEDFSTYVAATRQFLRNVIDWASAEPVELNQAVTAAHLDLLSKLEQVGIPAYQQREIANLASDLGISNLDKVMFQLMRAVAQTERYLNATQPKAARTNHYRWRISEQGEFIGYASIPVVL